MPRFTLSPQLFDNSAEVLASGKIYFYETGTNTLKNTFSDNAEATANANPVVLDSAGRLPDVFYTGSARVVIKDSDDVQLEVIDPWIPPDPTGGTKAFDTWDASVTYGADELAMGSDTKLYRSIAGSNLNNNPVSTSGFWSEANVVYLYDATRTFKENELCLSGDVIYRSIAGSNQANTPASSPTQWRAISTDDFNGAAAVYLDADRDTYLDLSTDDQIKIYMAGANDFTILANIFRALSGSVIETDTINETTTDNGVAVEGVVHRDSAVFVPELASANADVAAFGQFWVKDDTPNVPMFTDDAGTDIRLSSLAGTEAFTNKTYSGTVLDVKDTIFAISDGGSVDIDPANGRIQTWTLGANRTPTALNFANGQSVKLYIDDGTAFDVTWTTIAVTWLNNGGVKPGLATSGYTAVVLEKVGGTVYGYLAGNQT